MKKHCKKCGFEWKARVANPRSCPSCKTRAFEKGSAFPNKLEQALAAVRKELELVGLVDYEKSGKAPSDYRKGQFDVVSWLERWGKRDK